MTPPIQPVAPELIFQRSLSAHLPPEAFRKLRQTCVLVAGMGGGSNIAELLVRKGIGRLVIADPDSYEPHNVRQRGSTESAWGREKVQVMRARLEDVNPNVELTAVSEGVTLANVEGLVGRADIIVDMLDFFVLPERLALHRCARRTGKPVLMSPSIVNGAILYVFAPEGPSFEEFFGYEEGMGIRAFGQTILRRLVPRYTKEAPEEMCLAAARGERTIPLDAVGVDQAAVLAVGAVENLALGRRDRVVTVPRGIQVDVSDPSFLAQIVDFSKGFPKA